MTLRVVFFGNSQSVFSNRHFQALLNTPCERVGVIDVPPSKRSSTTPTTSDVPAFVELARAHGVPAFEPDSPNLPELVAAMRERAPDLFIAVGYTNILKEEILSVPRIVAANFHASLLPAYRGKHPVFWALRNGERLAGLTVHVMDPGIDTGDVLYQITVRIRSNDTVGSLYDRIMDKSVGLVRRLVRDAERGRLRRRPQPDDGASYYSSVSEEDFRLDWSWEAEKLRRRITITPGRCFVDVLGRRILLMDAEAVAGPRHASPGKILALDEDGCTIAVGEAAIHIRKVQQADGEVRPMAELCRELDLKQGDVLRSIPRRSYMPG